uniref:Gamma-glutamyltransferase 5a n=1 Tax=Mastacembelus armatus TaxID=205130 RepID=A0A7N8WMU6_9TELE
MAKYKPRVVCCCILAGVICAVAIVCLCIASLLDRRCSHGSFKHAAVSADSQLCSEVGREMLQQGGSAVDGAIAALLCTSVVNPQSMGIGGGSIITIRNKSGNVKVYNCRETVPRSFKVNLLNDCPTKFQFSTGSQWIGVPGELRGYEKIHNQYGKLPWRNLFQPAIRLAREGIPVPPYLGKLLNFNIVKVHVEKSSLCEILCNKNKTVLRHGDTLKFPRLADTLDIIANKGADAFYTGEIGHELIQDIKAAGFSLTPACMNGDQNIQMYHHFIEAVKFANGQKRSIRDPLFNKRKGADHLIDPEFISHIRKKISSNRTHENSYYSNVEPSPDHFGTTHVSVLDADGLAVAATSTINELFGGAVYSPRTGIILNNELSDFCHRADTVMAGEQPPSSMTPLILESESGGILVIGGSGGSMITTAVALSIINHLWLGMNLKDAVGAPVIFIDSINNLNFEPGFNKSVIDGLKLLGHKVGKWEYFLNVVNAVEKQSGCIVAVSDRRKMGVSAGY